MWELDTHLAKDQRVVSRFGIVQKRDFIFNKIFTFSNNWNTDDGVGCVGMPINSKYTLPVFTKHQ